MCLNVVAPEWSVIKALVDRASIYTHKRKFQQWSERDGVEWTTTHTYFADMGGFVLVFDSASETAKASTTLPQPYPASAPQIASLLAQVFKGTDFTNPQNPHPRGWDPEAGITSTLGEEGDATEVGDLSHNLVSDRIKATLRALAAGHFSAEAWKSAVKRLSRRIGDIAWRVDLANSSLVADTLRTIEESHFVSEGERVRFRLRHADWCRNLCALRGDHWVVDATQLLLARELGIIDRLPTVSENDLQDRSKGDLFVTVAAVGQIVWFVVQLINRLYQQLPTSQLEITILAFCLCSGVPYFLLLGKPKDVTFSINIEATRRPRGPEEMARLALMGPIRSRGHFRLLGRDSPRLCIPNDAAHLSFDIDKKVEGSHLMITAGWGSAALVFGAAHCVAWQFTFPTAAERLLWQASSIVTLAAPAVICLDAFYLTMRSRWTAGWLERVIRVVDKVLGAPLLVWLVLLLYTTSSIYILVEVFRSLAFLPPEAFVTSWPASLPHIGG